MNTSQNGFTILELMIATTVFSTILLVCTYGLIQIGNTYYKGATIARTQSVARSIVDDIAYEIQYNSSTPLITSGSPFAICIGPTQFFAKLDSNVSGPNHALQFTKDGNTACDTPSPGAKELLGDNMRLTEFSVTGLPTGSSVPDYYKIVVNVLYGETDLADTNDKNVCKGGSGSQFCASAHLETTVRRRIN